VIAETVETLELRCGVVRAAIKEVMLPMPNCDGLETDERAYSSRLSNGLLKVTRALARTIIMHMV
jgi:hypothetical protein